MDKIHISSGGVVYKVSENNQIEILLLHRKETDSWHLPKGTQENKEDLKKTALREVKEEIGFQVKIEKYLGKLPSLKEDKTPKITHYYLMRPIGRELEIFNHEEKYDRVEWVEIEKAKKLLSEFTPYHFMFYVYFIKSKRYDEIYVGSTNNLSRRLSEHNDGIVISTKRYKPWQLIYYEAYQSEKDAREREQKLKSHGNAIRELKKRIQWSLKNGAGFKEFEREEEIIEIAQKFIEQKI